MPKKRYALLENRVIDLFNQYGSFNFEGNTYDVVKTGKPRPIARNGECKTDVYIRGENSLGAVKELKISIKSRKSSEFLWNKMTPQDGEDALGPNWKEIITTATENISHRFEECYLIYPEFKGSTEADSITMGWKLEIANKQRNLSAELLLSEQEIRDIVYKGINQTQQKKDSLVNGDVVPGSGIADYILRTEIEDINSPEDVIEQMILLDNFTVGSAYLIFTANNYRTQVNSTDGNRWLAVIVEWQLVDGKLKPSYVYDRPLAKTGHQNKEHVQELLQRFGIQHPSQLDRDRMVYDPTIVWKR